MKVLMPWVILLFACSTAGYADRMKGEPFMKRILPADFLHLETINELSYSRSCTLVIYRTASGRIHNALTIKMQANDYVVTSELIDEPPEGMKEVVRKRTFVLPQSIGKRVHEAIQLMMEYNVFPPTNPQSDEMQSSDPNWWMLLRVSPTQVIAGFVDGYRMHHPRRDPAETLSRILFYLEDLSRDSAWDGDRDVRLKHLDVLTGTFIDSVRSAQAK